MNKVIKNILILILAFILCFVLYISIDCIRLRNSSTGTKPFITVSSQVTESRIIYKGLGYRVEYYVDSLVTQKDDIKMVEQKGYGAEFRLFDKLLIWAWAE